MPEIVGDSNVTVVVGGGTHREAEARGEMEEAKHEIRSVSLHY